MVKYYINKYSGIKNSVLFRLKNEELQMFTEFKGWIKHAPEKHPSSLDLEEVNLSIYLNNANDEHSYDIAIKKYFKADFYADLLSNDLTED
jgi:hypothetical protein